MSDETRKPQPSTTFLPCGEWDDEERDERRRVRAVEELNGRKQNKSHE
jgi:hypothetical protein